MAYNAVLEAFLPEEGIYHNKSRLPSTSHIQEESAAVAFASQGSKAWRPSFWVLLVTLSCIAVLSYHPLTTFLADQMKYPRSAGDLKLVTQGVRCRDGAQGLPSNLHRTSFHFQPEKNWMNDPNGPMYYKGYYHFFYQYNPHAAVWGEGIVWGHAVSADLIHWQYLDIALACDQWYDAQGVWSGSVTLRDDGVPIIMYTGSSATSEQTQNLATPSDPTDPFLRHWSKHANNPLLRHPPGISYRDFRDPTTAWKDDTKNQWLMSVGAQNARNGLALLYKSSDLLQWELHDGAILHSVANTGMWECVDFYPVAVQGLKGLEYYGAEPGVKFVLKASLDEEKQDYYAVGEYDEERARFVPEGGRRDGGLGMLYDHGIFYASKTFFDPVKERRVLWGWVKESDSEAADIAKGWASVQAIPRMVSYDSKTSSLVQMPVEEVQELRGAQVVQRDVTLASGALVEVEGAVGGQLDIEVEFEYPNIANITWDDEAILDNDQCNCNQGGLLIMTSLVPLAFLSWLMRISLNKQQSSFYVLYSKSSTSGKLNLVSTKQGRLCCRTSTRPYLAFCSRYFLQKVSSPLEVLVDRSIVESFVQGGRTVITSRVYPTVATDHAARLYLFNNATTTVLVRRVAAWQMDSVTMHAV